MILEALASLLYLILEYIIITILECLLVFLLALFPSAIYILLHEWGKGYVGQLIALIIAHVSIYTTIIIDCQQSIGGMQVLADPFTPPDIFIIGFLLAAAIYAAVLIYNKINYGVYYPHIMATKKGETQ